MDTLNVLLKQKKWLLTQQESDLGIGVCMVQDQKRFWEDNEDRPSHQLLTGIGTNSLSE